MSDVMIEASNLTKRYGSTTALRNVSFEVRKGEVLGFLGPNGAGKTTTMKILTCFIAPTEGTAKVNGADVFEDSIAVRSAIGYLPESTPLYTDMLVLEYLEFVAKMRGFKGAEAHKRIKKAVEETSLGDVIAKEIRALSKGFRQRVGLAQALVHEPPLLILDEPMSGLDPNQADEIRDLIRGIGRERTVILSTHNLSEVQKVCTRVLIVAKGKLVADDTPEELKARAGKASFSATFAKADAAKTRDLLGAIRGVDKVRNTGEDDGEVSFVITPTKDEDLRADIFKVAADNGLVLVGLGKKSADLGAIFRELTTGGDTKQKKAPQKAKAKAKVEAKAKVAEPEVAKPEVAKPEVAKPEVAKPEVAEPEVAKPEETDDSASDDAADEDDK